MTVVVMGFCFDRVPADPLMSSKAYLIAACDTKLSGADAIVQDSGVCKVQKAGFLGPWLAGYCDNPEFFLPVRGNLAKRLGPLSGNPDLTESEFLQALTEAYIKYRDQKIAERILNPWGIKDIQELRRSEHTNPKAFANLWAQVENFDLQLTLCVGGFSAKTGHQLRIISNPGYVTDNLATVSPGVIAIGSGAFHAESHLRTWYDKGGPLKEALYYVLEAKFIADMQVPTVGTATDLIIVQYHPQAQPVTTSFRVSRERVESFREAWEAERRNPSKSLLKLLDVEPLLNF